jgi:hypothetical protein
MSSASENTDEHAPLAVTSSSTHSTIARAAEQSETVSMESKQSDSHRVGSGES